jgi:hypothetical protein
MNLGIMNQDVLGQKRDGVLWRKKEEEEKVEKQEMVCLHSLSKLQLNWAGVWLPYPEQSARSEHNCVMSTLDYSTGC